MMKIFEAAQVLCRAGNRGESMQILQKLWESPQLKPSDEFRVFCALVEIWTLKEPRGVIDFVDAVLAGEGNFQDFASRRSLAEQGILLDWQGQIAFKLGDKARAHDALGRAASLGRDTSLIWRQLGSIHIEQKDLDLGLRYIRRSLHLFRQLDLDLVSGRDEWLGTFAGQNPLATSRPLEAYLELLLQTTRLAKGQRNLKAVRELVLEMIHQFPEEPRLPKIRLLMERAIVESSLNFGVAPAGARLTLSPPAISR